MSGSSVEQEDLEELWLLNLQEFFETLQPHIVQIEALTAIEEFLSNLESTDPNFHRYNFVCKIRDHLDLQISPLIANAINIDSVNDKQDSTLTANFIDKILSSKEFLCISSDIDSAVQTAAQDFSKHLRSDTFDFSTQDVMQKHERQGEFFDATSSMCSTTDGMDFMFMQPNRYNSLARDINNYTDHETLLKTMDILQQVPQTDLVACNEWAEIRKGILRALDSDNDEINMKAMKFISRLFLSGSSHVICEYFSVLVENLTDYFTDTTSHFVFLESGLDLGDHRNIVLLKKFRLLNNIQKEMTVSWLRYNEKFVKEIINKFIFFLGISASSLLSNAPLMNPLMFVSMVDPYANWFKSWMHGYYSRVHLIKSIDQDVSFLHTLLENFVEVCGKMNNEHISGCAAKNDDEFVYSHREVSYTYFLHSLYMLQSLLLYKDSRVFLNYEMESGGTMSTAILLNALVKVLTTYPNIPHVTSSKLLLHAGVVTTGIFRIISNSGVKTLESCLCYDSIYEAFSMYFWEIANGNRNMGETCIQHVMDTLAEIAMSRDGHVQLLKKRSIVRTSQSNVSLLDGLNDVFLSRFDTKQNVISSNVLLSLLCLCQRLMRFMDGLAELSKYNLQVFLSNCYKAQNLKTNLLLEKIKNCAENREITPLSPESSGSGSSRRGGDNLAYKKSINVEKQILDTILHLALTPRGLSIFLQTEHLQNCVTFLHINSKSKKDFVKTPKNGYGSILYHIASTTSGINALSSCGYVQDLLQEIWSHLEGCVNNYTLTILDELPEDMTNCSSKKILMSTVELVSTLNSVSQLFATKQTTCTSQPGLNCFEDIMTRLILIDSPEKLNALYYPNHTHLFGLNVLSFVVTSLDSMLCLQSRFHFEEILLKMQAACQHDNNSFIIDECSVKRNQLLVMSYLLGGPTERTVPLDTLTQDASAPYPWPLFCTYPVPGVYSLKASNSAVTNAQQDDSKSRLRELVDEMEELASNEMVHALDELRELFFTQLDRNNLKVQDELVADVIIICTEALCTSKENKLVMVKLSTKQHGKDVKTINSNESFKSDERQAIDMIVRYGVFLKQLRSQNEATESLKKLLSYCDRCFHYTTDRSSNHVINDNYYQGFDWFVAIIFLLFYGDEDKATLFLDKFATTTYSLFLWPKRAFDVMSTEELQDVHPIFTNTCHFVEYILEKDLPQIHAAFQMSGYPASHICQHWLKQCFLNYLDWSDIVWYVAGCIVLGLDYQVYMCVAILKHLKKHVLEKCTGDELVLYLRYSPIVEFHVGDHFVYMKELQLKYRDMILSELSGVI